MTADDLRWDGCVIAVDGDMFTAEVQRDGHPALLADFSMAECGVMVVPGDVLIVTPSSVVKREPRVWTRRELAQVMRRARKRSKVLRRALDVDNHAG